MRLSEKLRKTTNGAAWESVVDAYYRWKHPLENLCDRLDQPQLRKLQAEYGVPGEKTAWPKYINTPQEWINLAIRQARELHLDREKPGRILDIGSGAGYFLYVCKQLGHSGMGLDLPEPPLYTETFQLMGLTRVIHRIEPFQTLPDLGVERFDWVTGFAVCFNNHDTPQLWGPREWEFFLNNLQEKVLKPKGKIFFQLNPEPHGYYTPKLKDFFVGRGAQIDRNRIRM
jgi:SAM-dependent methyltransferase